LDVRLGQKSNFFLLIKLIAPQEHQEKNMETPIHEDQAFLDQLYKRFDYLKDYPCEFNGMFINEALSLGILHSDGFLGAVLGYPVDEFKTRDRNYFPFLPAEVNLNLSSYRLLTPVIPWPQPIIGIAMAGDHGEVTGIHAVPVLMQKIGKVQVWYGQEVALIFECFLEGQVQQDPGFEVLMNQLWSICEEFLMGQGVSQIYALGRDPALDDAWFRGHLERRGYQPLSAESVTWLKQPG
jgi:hypothetical protein